MPSTEANGVRGRGRPRKLDEADELALVNARRDGTPWKVLVRRYDVSRSRLHEAWKRGLARISGHLLEISGHHTPGRRGA